ncbi:MAG: PEGA domain-containing protein [Deltaproteobacteria bacterium]|nr:PEGA domain-containing protein [Deltaproteobacteria bacterium]
MSSFDSDSERFTDAAFEEAERLLRYEDGDPHLRPEDDLSRRRAIDKALAQVDEHSHNINDEHGTSHPRRYKRLIAIGAVAAAAMIVWGAQTTLAPTERSQAPQGESTSTRPAALLASRVLLVSGIGQETDQALVAGREVREGESIRIDTGDVVLGLSDKAKVLVREGTLLKVQRLREDVINVFLERGELLASVEPGKSGPRLIVSTTAGRVAVKGTIFTVSVLDDDADVRVFRGAVQVERNGMSTRSVRASQRVSMASKTTASLTPEEEAQALKTARSLELLAGTAETLLDIASVPSGATVMLDGEVLGVTPLVAATRTGHRDLELMLEKFAPVRERLQLGRGDTVQRVFEMSAKKGVGASAKKKARPGEKTEHAGVEHASAPVETAGDILKRAQSLRASRDWSGAADMYRLVARRFPMSAEARTGAVSLGAIQLNHLGEPQRALEGFDAYLSRSPSGALAPEAALGRAKALGVLGRTHEEASALRDFLRRFPSSLNAPQARRRLAEMQ